MEFRKNLPPREFQVGFDKKSLIYDCGSVSLAPDEQLTFITEDGKEYDVTRKSWGFYATPSMNGRLAGFGLRAVMVKNSANRFFVLLVETGKESLFEQYVREEQLVIISWLDGTEQLIAFESKDRHENV